MSTLRDLARCDRSRIDRRGALATLLTGFAISGLGFKIRAERNQLQDRHQRRRHYASGRRRQRV